MMTSTFSVGMVRTLVQTLASLPAGKSFENVLIGNIKHATLKVSSQQNHITKKTYKGRGCKALPLSAGAPLQWSNG